jgi:hypothetical protein
MKKTIYKTVFTVEVLSDEPIGSGMSLSDIASEGDDGSLSIMTKDVYNDKPIKGIRAVRELEKQGTDPEFFMMDDQGNELED